MPATRVGTSTVATGNGIIQGSQGAQLASASTVTLTSFVHEITGSTTITTLAGGQANAAYVLIPATGASWRLTANDIDVTAVPGVPISLVYDGSKYRLLGQPGNSGSPWVNVKDFGAVADGVTDDKAAIQSAINSLSSGAVYFPPGTYLVNSEIVLKSNVHLRGEGKQSLLKIGASSAYSLLGNGGGTNWLENVSVDRLGFDGSLTYPANSNVYRGSVTQNLAFYIHPQAVDGRSTNDAKNVAVTNCYFYKFSYGAIYITGLNVEDILISGNYFEEGAYYYKCVGVDRTAGGSDAQRPRRIVVTNNRIDQFGPQVYYDASKDDYISSCDAIAVDDATDVIIASNTIQNAASIGIRVEGTWRATVSGNVIAEPGNEGIFVYGESKDIAIVGNTVKNWGRTPMANCIRTYGGARYIARQDPDATHLTLPADPSITAWFEVWPYQLTGVDTSTLRAYDNADYTLTPYRGDAAICVSSASTNCTITGNTTSHSESVDGGGKFLYGSDYGLSFVHPTNPAGPDAGLDCYVGLNRLTGRVYGIYHPEKADPTAAAGLSQTLGKATYAGRPYTESLIRSNRPLFSVRAVTTENDNLVAGGARTIVWGSEITDQGANFASNTFTAPVTGQYQMNVTLDLRNLDSAATLYEFNIVTSNRSYPFYLDPGKLSADPTHFSISMSHIVDMDAADTATVTFTQTGGANQTDVEAGSLWTGFLLE